MEIIKNIKKSYVEIESCGKNGDLLSFAYKAIQLIAHVHIHLLF